ncbi:MAG: hypothetical protein AAFU61_07525 [Pseudomonadota bacterium]
MATASITSRLTTSIAAAPSTPQPKPGRSTHIPPPSSGLGIVTRSKIRNGSSAAVTTPALSVVIIARRASPSARRIDDPTMPKVISGRLGRLISRKRDATSSASPSAPSRCSSTGSRAATASTVTAVSTPAVTASEVPASRRAAGRSRAPRLRLTSAVAAMAKPMPTLMAKNWITQAKPSAAT